jgi:hypothetical protein
MRLSFVLVLALAAAGCALDGLPPMDPGPGPGGDPDLDEEPFACEAELAVTGSLTPPGAPPTAEDGCVPTGLWTVHVALVDQGNCPEVPFLPQYEYEVTGSIDEGYAYTYLGDPTNENVSLKVTQGGPGDCEGNFEHHSADGMSLLLLKPFERDLAITGAGYYEVYTTPQN